MVTPSLLKSALCLLSALLVLACTDEQLASKQPPAETAKKQLVETSEVDKTNGIINLAIDQIYQHQDFTLEFMQVSDDSRCAKGVECVWAGNAQIVLLASDNNSAQTLTLNTSGKDPYPNSANFAGYKIELLDLAPYPAVNIRIDPTQRTAKLKIAKRGLDSAQERPVIIDVRTSQEYQTGHYPKAVNLNYETIEQTIDGLNLDKGTEIIVYCRSGRRSGIAKETLEKLGYNNVTNGINQDNLQQLFGASQQD